MYFAKGTGRGGTDEHLSDYMAQKVKPGRNVAQSKEDREQERKVTIRALGYRCIYQIMAR